MRLFRFDDPTRKPDLSRLNDHSRFLHPRYHGCVLDVVQAEGGGTRFSDSSSTGNHGALQGTVGTWGVDGYQFNGSDNYLLFADHPSYDFTDFTITAIVNSSSYTANSGLLRKSNNYTLDIASGSLRFLVWRSGGTTSLLVGSTPTVNTWRQVNARYRVGVLMDLSIYSLDASVMSYASTSTNVLAHSQTSDALWVGRGFGAYLPAVFRLVRVYRRWASDGELESLREAPYLEYQEARSWWFVPSAASTSTTSRYFPLLGVG